MKSEHKGTSIDAGRAWRLAALSILLLGAGTLGSLGLETQSAFAGNPDPDCIQDQWNAAGNRQKLTCTANDVRVASASNIRDVTGKPLDTCIAGSTFSFVADFLVVLGAQERFDIGLYFATDGDEEGKGDGAITGDCAVNIIEPLSGDPALGSANFIQLDAVSQPGDICGDIDAANNPQVVTVQVDNVVCQDAGGDGFLDLPNCTSWRQGGANEVCLSTADAFPGSPSKCNCDPDFNIPVMVEPGNIGVTKTAGPPSLLPEPGGEFTFTVHVQNEAQFTKVRLNRICDSDHGEIANATEFGCPTGSIGAINNTTCTVPQILGPDDGKAGGADEYTCTFTADIISKIPVPNEQDTVTVYGLDESDNEVSDTDTASVGITDVLPTAMVTKAFDQINCVNVTYEVDVRNTSKVESLTLTALNDSAFGSLTSVHDDVTATNCSVPRTIEKGATYSCSFDADFCGTTHTNSATATLNDNDVPTTIMVTSDSVTVTVSGSQQ
ncbi:MAG: hypothetical protein OEQ74_09575 [Gammaproteobacteria bacterium]|nr:hypothetical protein [Gammaproteobacteria bacterium]